MPIVNGTLTDFGLDPLSVNNPVLLFRASTTGLAGLNLLSATKAVEVVPAENGYFEADLVATSLIAPETTHYTVEIRYRDTESRTRVSEVLPWKLLVPPEGGTLGDLLRVPANPALVWTGTQAPIEPSPGTWWLDPTSGDLAELDGDGETWIYKANLRGPAGMNATDAAGDDAAIAAFINAPGAAAHTAVSTAIAGEIRELQAGALAPIAGSNQWASVGAAAGNSHNSLQPYTAAEELTHVAPVYAFGGFTQEDSPAGIAASVTVRAAVEYPEGTIRPLFFNGQRSITLEPGGVVIADPLSFTIPKGALFFIRTYATKPTAGNFIFNHQTGTFTTAGTSFATARAGNMLDGGETGTDLTDKTKAGAIPAVAGVPTFVPWAVFGQSPAPRISVLIPGDSIARGQGAAGNIGSWTHQALNITEANASRSTKLLAKYGWISAATSGETIANLLAVHGMRLALLRYVTHALGSMGTNDLGAGRTAAQIKADKVALWQILAKCGVRAYFGTIPPQSTSTDGWATLENQTPGHLAARTDINDWMRNGAPLDPVTLAPVATGTPGAVRTAYYDGAVLTPASGPAAHPLAAAFELADAVESARNSGKWRINSGVMTTDGTHPNPAAYKLMGAKAAPVVATWTI